MSAGDNGGGDAIAGDVVSEQGWALSEWFDALVDLPVEQQEARLLQAPEALRESLRSLLRADRQALASAEDPVSQACASVAQSLIESSALGSNPERRIGPYRVLRELGSGGMGTVLLAERADGLYAQKVAIKLIRGFPTEEVKRRLRLERQILAQLDHPNIARLLDGGETQDGQPYVVLDYVDGLGLLDYVAHKALDLRARLVLFDQIAAAVQHAHERLVIHRDLKPGNVLVRPDGVPKLLDFGIAKLLDVTEDGVASRQTSTRVWTPGYASPEQERGELVTTASDVFGLAILLREMLCGERGGAQPSAVPAGFHACELDRDLRDILAAAAAVEVSARYPTVEALRSDLLRWREGRTVRVATRSGWYRLRKFIVRHRFGVAAGLLLFLTLLGGVLMLEAERSRAVLAEQQAELARDSARRDADSARAALKLLTDTLVSVAPEQAMSTSVSIQTLLEALDQRVDSQLATQPELRRYTQVLLGKMYLSMSNPVRAAELLTEGLKDAEPASAEEAIVLSDAYDSLASALCAQEQGEAGQRAAEQSSLLRQRYVPDDEVEQLRAQHTLGFGHYCAGDWDGAVEIWEASVQRAERLTPAPVDVLADDHRMLAGVKVHLGEYDDGLQHAEAALRLITGTQREGSPAHIAVLRHQAEALAGQNQLSRSLEVLDQALAYQDRVFDTDSHQRMLILNVRGTVLNDAGRFREALQDFETTLAINRTLRLGAQDLAKALGNIATVRESAGDYSGALQAFDEALQLNASAASEVDYRDTRTLQVNRARALGQAERFVEAREALQSLLSTVSDADDSSPFEKASIMWQLAVLETNAGRPDAAEPNLQQALEAFRQIVPEGHVVFAYADRYAAVIAMLRGDYEQALDVNDRALTALLDDEGRAFDVAIARLERAFILQRLQQADLARAQLALVIPVLQAAVLPTQRDRWRAERLAASLGMRLPVATDAHSAEIGRHAED